MAAEGNSVGKDEFRSAIQQQLLADGVLQDVTASVRARLLGSLLKENGGSTGDQRDVDCEEMALLSLIYHHLDQKEMPHTLSVFAAESRMEHSLQYPLSSVEAVKALGLQGVWHRLTEDNVERSIDLLSLLQAVGSWVSEPSFQAKSKASTSVQTDAETEEESNKENAVNQCKIKVKGLGSSKAVEERLLQIERECQQRMKEELDSRLRLSAKKQAAYAAKRVESMHKEALSHLRHQMEEERAQAKRRHEELLAEMEQQKLKAHKDNREMARRVESLSLEKQRLQSDFDALNEKVKATQQERLMEWTDENEKLAASRRELQLQLNDISMQRDAIKSTELKLASLAEHRDSLLVDLQRLQREKSQALELQQSSFEKSQAKLQRQFHNAKADLDASRSEVLGLRALLKQSQAALGTLSFREVGAAGTRASMPPAIIYNRDGTGAPTPVGPRLPTRSGCNTVPSPSPLMRASSQTQNDDSPAPHLDAKEEAPVVPPGVKPVIPEDPPCNSAKDPPTTTPSVSATADTPDDESDSHSSMNVVVGELALDVSGITEEVFSRVPRSQSASPQGSKHVASLSVPPLAESKRSEPPRSETTPPSVDVEDIGVNEERSGGKESTIEKASSQATLPVPEHATAESKLSFAGDDARSSVGNGGTAPSSESNECNAVATASLASASEAEYTAFDETNQTASIEGSGKPSVDTEEEDNAKTAFPESPNSSSSSSDSSNDGYSESFCSEI